MTRWSRLWQRMRGMTPPAEPAPVVVYQQRETNAWIFGVVDGLQRPTYSKHELQYDAQTTVLSYLEQLGLSVNQVKFVSLRGDRIEPQDVMTIAVDEPLWIRGLRKLFGIAPLTYEVNRFEHQTLQEGDQLFIVPALEGKNAALILGVVGAVIGWVIFPGNPWSFGALQYALAGYAIGTFLGSLMTPRPSTGKGDNSLTRYGWEGVQNEYRAGTPIPIAVGRCINVPVRVGMYVARESHKVVFSDITDGSQSYQPPAGPNEVLHLLFLLSIGPIATVTNVLINGQPYTNYGGDIAVDYRLGVPGQSVLVGFNQVISTQVLSTELTTTPFVYTTTMAVQAFAVLISIPGLFHYDNKGNLQNNQTHYKIAYRVHGTTPWTNVPDFDRRMNGSTRSIVWDTPTAVNLPLAIYDIQMTWVAPTTSHENIDPTTDAWKVFATGVNEITSKAPTYDYGDHQYAMLAVTAIATDKLNGGTPLVTCVTEGVSLPITNGTSITGYAYSRNPAYAALYLFLNTTVGAGNWIEGIEDIDLQSFKDWADYCAELVTVTPDVGAPYTEPRHLFDCVINQQRPFLDTLLDLCATARATPVMVGEKWKMAIDRPGNVQQTFTGPGNIIENSLSVAYRSDSVKVNAYDVSIMDEANNWNVEPFRVISNQLVTVLGDPVRPEPITLWGTNRRSQGTRDVTFRLNGIAFLRRMAQFLAYTDAILVEAGDVIAIAHDIPQWGFPGRATAGSTTSITLDRPVVIQTGTTYEVLIRLQDGSNGAGEVRTVTTAPSTTNVLTFTPALAHACGRDDIYAFGPLTLSTKPYRVVAISRTAGGMRKIVGLEYFSTLYDDSGIVTTPVYSQLPNVWAPPPALTSLALTELTEERTDLSRPSTLLIQWDRPLPVVGKGIFDGARLDRSWNGGVTFEFLAYASGTEYRWQHAPQNVAITIRATPRSTKGMFNDAGAKTSSPITLTGWTTPPPAVIASPSVPKDGRFGYFWTGSSRAIQYEARLTDTGWGADSNFVYRDHAPTFEIVKPLARTVVLYVRALDQFGNYSTTTAISCTDVAPAAPTPLTASIVASDELIKIPVTPPADLDVIALHLHASTTNGFTPLASNRIASVVGPKGGDFTWRPPASSAGPWYFRVTSEDPLSERLDDWIYSAQFSASLAVVVPQSPTGITFADSGVTGRHRAVAGTSSGTGTTTLKTFLVFVNWTWSDVVNPASTFLGFQVIVYQTGSDPHAPFYTSPILTDVSARSLGIPDLTIESAATYIAAVRAVYNTASSPFITSTGLALDPTSGEVLQGGNDRPVGAYADNFAGVAVPTGFSKNSTDSWFVSGGLTVTAGNRSSSWIQWDLAAWGAQYLDTMRGTFDGFSVMIAIQLQNIVNFANPAAPQFSVTVQHGDGGASTTIAQKLVSDRTGYQFYRIDFPNVGNQGTIIAPPASSGPLAVTIDMSGVFNIDGLQWDVKGIAVSFDGVTVLFDGHVDRAIKARLQFGKDPLGGFFGIAPVRLTDDVGNVTIVDSNGGTFLSVSGQVYKNLKRVFRATHEALNNDQTLFWGAFGGEPTFLLSPAATNKTHILISQFTGSYEDNIPTYRPVRKYLEATCVSDLGWRVQMVVFEGGSFSKALFSSLGNSAASKAAMTLDANTSATVNSGSDAWFNSTGRGLPTANYYRTVLWIAATMPDVKKSNGSRYWIQLYFTVNSDFSIGASNPMTLAGSGQVDNVTNLTLRGLSDGTTWYLPVVYSNGPQTASAGPRSFKVNYQSLAVESGLLASPSLVWLDQINFYYWTAGGVGTSYAASATDVEFTIAEET